MSSNIEIKKKCKWCGQIFIARKTTTNYCSHRCNNAAYKERIRQERIATYQKEFSIKTEKPSIEDKEFYTPPEAAKLLRISRASIYRYMADNIITHFAWRHMRVGTCLPVSSSYRDTIYRKMLDGRD